MFSVILVAHAVLAVMNYVAITSRQNVTTSVLSFYVFLL
jgi:hypothetical protein